MKKYIHCKEKICYICYVDKIVITSVQNKMYEGVNLKEIHKIVEILKL